MGLRGLTVGQPQCQEEGMLPGATRQAGLLPWACVSGQHCIPWALGFLLPFWGRKCGLAMSQQPHCLTQASPSHSQKLQQPQAPRPC